MLERFRINNETFVDLFERFDYYVLDVSIVLFLIWVFGFGGILVGSGQWCGGGDWVVERGT